MHKAELVTAKSLLTPFGNLLLKSDPYLLNVGILWFIHYFMSSNARLVIWSRLFDTIAYQEDEIKPFDILNYFLDMKGDMTDRVFQKNGANEIGAILRTYTDELFRPIGLVVKIDKGRYTVISDDFLIHPLIWLSSILSYRDRYYPTAATLETHLLGGCPF